MDIQIKYYVNQWWLRLTGADAMAIGRNVFFKRSKGFVSDRLIRHEQEHVRQCSEYLLLGQWWIATLRFITVYIGQWLGAGFRYSKMRFEIEAREAERKKK